MERDTLKAQAEAYCQNLLFWTGIIFGTGLSLAFSAILYIAGLDEGPVATRATSGDSLTKMGDLGGIWPAVLTAFVFFVFGVAASLIRWTTGYGCTVAVIAWCLASLVMLGLLARLVV